MMQGQTNPRTFVSNSRHYLVDVCKWQSVLKDDTRSQNLPSKRYSHSTDIADGYLYLFGGTNNGEQHQNQEVLYTLNLKNMKWQKICGKITLQIKPRDSHGLTVHNNDIYIYSGSNNAEKQLEDLIIYNPLHDKWTEITPFISSQRQTENDLNLNVSAKPEIRSPSPRDKCLFFSVNDEYIFMFGGINIEKEEVYSDAYILRTFGGNYQWLELEVVNCPSKRIGMGVAKCGKRVFMFGGEGTGVEQVFYKDLYEIVIDEIELIVTFRLIRHKSLEAPMERAHHGMVALGKNYLLVIAGQTYNRKPETRTQKENKSLNDIWIYDIFEMSWFKVLPKNGPIKSFHAFSISTYENNVYMFGGMKNSNTLVQDFIVLTFAEAKVQKLVMCQSCKQLQQIRSTQTKQPLSNPTLSVGFFYNMALQVKFPFQAFSLVLDAIRLLKASQVRISIEKVLSNLQYISIDFNGDCLQKEELKSLITHGYSDSKMRDFSNCLKLGCFRLGKTLLFISASEKNRRVFMLSADSKITPDFEQNYQFYHYCEDIQAGTIEGYHGAQSKAFIINALESQMDSLSEALSLVNRNKLLILSPTIITTTEKFYYHQLIPCSESQDIFLYRNSSQMKFMKQSLGMPIFSHPEISLSSYLQLYEVNCKLKIYINSMEQPLIMTSYHQILKKLNKNSKIKRFQTSFPFDFKTIKYTCELYELNTSQFVEANQGVLLYYHGRLINRLDCCFGDIFFEKFYKKNYRNKLQNLFSILGTINITNCLTNTSPLYQQYAIKTNLFRTGFDRKNIEYQKLCKEVLKIILAKEEEIETKAIQILQSREIERDEKITKKVKSN